MISRHRAGAIALATAFAIALGGPAIAKAQESSEHSHPHTHRHDHPHADGHHGDEDPEHGEHTHHDKLPRPDGHAPIGVMGDHRHAKGEWMLSYRYSRMRMDGNLDGTNDRSIGEIVRPGGDFLVTPTDMDMQMHMFGIMWAPHDRVTLMGMLPYVILEMDHQTAMGVDFTTRSKGLGDISVAALVGLWENETHSFHLNAGVSFPSGSIDRKDDTPASMGKNVQLPYPMQLGSGTVDLKPGLTYNGRLDFLSWGAQASGVIRLGRNEENYRLGNRYNLTSWGAVPLFEWMSVGGRVSWEQWLDVQGKDDRIPDLTLPDGTVVPAKNVIPTADPDLRGGERLDIGPSINLVATRGMFKGVRFGVEALFPAYQNLDGPQLESKWRLIAGLQYAF